MIFKHDYCLVTQNDIERCVSELSDYRKYIQNTVDGKGYLYNESSINLPSDQNQLTLIRETLKNKISDNLSLIIVIGIGGSSLGSKAVYNAFFGAYDGLDIKKPKVIFAETNDPEYELHIENTIEEKVLSPENILVFTITKSGKTDETILNKNRIAKILANKFSFNAIKERFVYITEKNTELWKEGKEKRIDILEIPEKIGGRFSVFSAAGLAPIFAAGINIKDLLDGAEDIKNKCLSKNLDYNIAIVSAAIAFLSYKKGNYINDSFFFEVELESLGKWYRQLLSESIGKKKNESGHIVHIGITPTISIGTQDLHSMLELNLGGPKNKLTSFVSVEEKSEGEDEYKNAMVKAYKKTKDAYIKNNLPFNEIVLPKLSEYYLGQYMQFKMIETMYLGKLFNINPFIQPSVEGYKKDTPN